MAVVLSKKKCKELSERKKKNQRVLLKRRLKRRLVAQKSIFDSIAIFFGPF